MGRIDVKGSNPVSTTKLIRFSYVSISLDLANPIREFKHIN